MSFLFLQLKKRRNDLYHSAAYPTFPGGCGNAAVFGRHGHKSILCSAGALLYVFSLFSIVRGLHFYSLLSTMYLFPFLLIELEKIILQKRPYKAMAGFAALIGIQTSCSFYFCTCRRFFCWAMDCFSISADIKGTGRFIFPAEDLLCRNCLSDRYPYGGDRTVPYS